MQAERRADGTFPKTVQQQKLHFRMTHFPRKILGTFFEVVFLGTIFDNFFYFLSGHEIPYNSYCTTVGTKIEAVHSRTITLAWFSRQRVGRNFDCKISEFSQFAEHCG